jgi:hypothetical protein
MTQRQMVVSSSWSLKGLFTRGNNPPSAPIPYVLWDPWPNEVITLILTKTQWEALSECAQHWAAAVFGYALTGDREGINAEDWQKGYHQRRKCRGVVECTNSKCLWIARPDVTCSEKVWRQRMDSGRDKCTVCESPVRWVGCGVHADWWQYKGGNEIRYTHSGIHLHRRPPDPIHLTALQKEAFADLVRKLPELGPQALVVGAPGRPSVANISSALLNVDRVGKERAKIQKDGWTGQWETDVQKLKDEFPEAVGYTNEELGVITIQTEAMAAIVSDSIQSGPKENDRIYGFVTDAAHKFFRGSNDILIQSSRYVEVAHMWMPVLATYSKGQSAEHYAIHFQALLGTVHKVAEVLKQPMEDIWMINVRTVSCYKMAAENTDAIVIGPGFQSSSAAWIYRCLYRGYRATQRRCFPGGTRSTG